MDRFIKEKQHTSTDIMGFELLDEQIGESEFKAPLNKSKVQQPAPKTKTTTSSHTPLQEVQALYVGTSGWRDATETIQRLSLDCPPRITEDYGMSLLIQCASLELGCSQHKDPDFVKALADVIRTIGLKKLPSAVAAMYVPFFEIYDVYEQHKDRDHLGYLFKLAEKGKASLKWVAFAECPWLVTVDYDNLEMYSAYYEVLKLFMGYPQLYSWPYIAFMRTQLSDAGVNRIPTSQTFLEILRLSATFNPFDLSRLFDQFYSLKVGGNQQIYSIAIDLLKAQPTLEMSELLANVAIAPKV